MLVIVIVIIFYQLILKLMTVVVVMMVMTKMMCDVSDNSVDTGGGGGGYDDDDRSHDRLSLSVVALAYVYQRYVRVVFSHILLMLLNLKILARSMDKVEHIFFKNIGCQGFFW